jgi:hypothetical protein
VPHRVHSRPGPSPAPAARCKPESAGAQSDASVASHPRIGALSSWQVADDAVAYASSAARVAGLRGHRPLPKNTSCPSFSPQMAAGISRCAFLSLP